MFALLAAATVQIAAPPLAPAPESVILQQGEVRRTPGTPVCSLGKVFQTAPESMPPSPVPQLAFKLIELPRGQLCLASSPAADAGQPVRVVSADGVPVSVQLVKPTPLQAAAAARKELPMPNLYQVPERCRNLPYRVVDQYGRPVTTRLADLPRPGGLQLLVDRRVQGCPVVTVKYGVVAPDDPNPPAERYRIEPLDPSGRKR